MLSNADYNQAIDNAKIYYNSLDFDGNKSFEDYSEAKDYFINAANNTAMYSDDKDL